MNIPSVLSILSNIAAHSHDIEAIACVLNNAASDEETPATSVTLAYGASQFISAEIYAAFLLCDADEAFGVLLIRDATDCAKWRVHSLSVTTAPNAMRRPATVMTDPDFISIIRAAYNTRSDYALPSLLCANMRNA